MSKYLNYREYNKSSLSWVNLLPKHWDVGNLRWFSRIYAGGTPSKKNEEFWNNGVIPWLNSGTVNQGVITEPSTYITIEAYNNSSAKWIKKDSLVIALAGQGKTKGMVAQLGIDATCNQSMAAIVPCDKYVPRFLYWWLDSNYQNIRNMAGGDLRDGLNLELLGGIECPIPTTKEQQKIADFLDRETTKIDTLIEKQKRLIQLLEEKRQAVISHSVTKGLNPNVKMKDSGVQWLGEVPEHWNVRKVKSLFQIRKRIAGMLGFDVLSITQKGIKAKDIESGEGQLSMDYTKYQLVEAGDYAMNHMDLLTGWVDISKQKGVTSPDYRVFSLVENQADPKYYLFVLQMGYSQKLFYAFGQGSSHLGRWRFPTETFKSFKFPEPPVNEQKEISNYIDCMHYKIDNLVDKTKKAIALLNERRMTLISAAVTGKIDVRNIKQRIINEHKTDARKAL